MVEQDTREEKKEREREKKRVESFAFNAQCSWKHLEHRLQLFMQSFEMFSFFYSLALTASEVNGATVRCNLIATSVRGRTMLINFH